MRTRVKLVFSLVATALAACTNTGLHRNEGPPPAPPKEVITVQGTFCTEDPETVSFPVKVWLVIDDTGSMQQNDPNQARYEAAKNLAMQLEDTQPPPDMFFGAMKFAEGGTGTLRITQPERFTPVAADFIANINAVQNPGNGGTPYVTALNFTFGELSQDVTADPIIARRTRYVIIFLSDGVPTGDDDNPQSIAAATTNVMSLEDNVGGITLNTVYLGGGNAGAEQILMEMSQIGKGIYKSFPNGDTLDYTDFDFSSIRRNYNQRFFMISNIHAFPTVRGHQIDSDADGLPDYRELDIGTELTKRDTDDDGCGDLFEFRDAGWDPVVPGTQNNQCICTPAQKSTDTDKDGLTDCEEKWIGSSSYEPDADKNEDDTVIGDLVWDGFDHIYLNNVLFPNDGMDYDVDGYQDLTELRVHTDPAGSDDARGDWAYDYVFLDQQPENPRCYDFQVDNVSVMKTEATPLHPAGENEIVLYYAQSPQDNAQKEKSFRVARVNVNYNNLGTVTVGPEQFDEILVPVGGP